MIYPSVRLHAGLLGRAKADAGDPAQRATFDVQQLLAERLLGLSAPAVTEADAVAMVQMALALQINYQYELGVNAFVYSRLATQPNAEDRSYRDDVPQVSPQAETLVNLVLYPDGRDLAEDFRTVASARGPQA